jgi:exonuclease III
VNFDNLCPIQCDSDVAKEHDIPVIVSSRLQQNVTSRCNATNLHAIKLTNAISVTSHKLLKFGYLNARSCRDKATEISDFVIDNNIDVCTITETWLGKGDRDRIMCGDLTPSGYKRLHVPQSVGRGGGVAVIHTSSLKIVKQQVPNHTSYEAMELVLSTGNDSVRLIVVYRPPAGSKRSKPSSIFLDEFQSYLDSLALSQG